MVLMAGWRSGCDTSVRTVSFGHACVGFHYLCQERRFYYEGICIVNYVAQKFKSQNEFQQQTERKKQRKTQTEKLID